MTIPYDKTCRYEFRAKTYFLKNCITPALVSEMSEPVTYGNDFSWISEHILVKEINIC